MVKNRVKGISVALLASVFVLFLGSAQAVEVSNLYQASVLVPDRGAEELRHGSQEALAEVLIRVSGDSRALESYDINQAMGDPQRYIEQYGFTREVQVNPETELPEPVYRLNVTFNPRSINQLIRRAGLPIWASNRAEVLIWLAMETAGGRQLVTADNAPELVATLSRHAKRRGLPIAFPINDLQDQLAVTMGDIWGMFMERIEQGSQRYAPGAILVGKVYQPGSDGLGGIWTYSLDGSQEVIETQGVELTDVLAPAIDFAADKLAEKYAVVIGDGDSEYLWLNVDGVQNLTDFARLTEYLDKLVAVKQAAMDRLQEDKIRFRVYLESDVENLKQLLALDKKLIELPQPQRGLSVSLAAPAEQTTVVSGEGTLVAPAGAQTLASDEAAAEKPTPKIELHYHWHRTYVTDSL